ncbi:MAG: HAMP domain-containing histidine kinase [Clostridia bacterium]|nr:HAMP domain-containing histidine kinase [Clostridia bacterium]
MFKKTKIKIVVAIMSILALLWVGTLGVIYASSYFEMQEQNRQMLRVHAQNHALSDGVTPLQPQGHPKPDGNPAFRPGLGPESPMFRLSTFYTVALDEQGQTLEIENESPALYTDEELVSLARELVAADKTDGTRKNLTFHVAKKDGYTLVTFMDNTVINQRAMTLFRYTLIFGGLAMVVFFCLSVFLAKKIVDPLEQSYQKQKQFISDAGHELKTPVSVVSANAELLAREVGENRWLQNIQYENQRMGALVVQLLDLARAETAAPQMEALDFSRLVAGETLPFESVAYEKGLTLTNEIEEGLRVVGNAPQLGQIVSVLLDNAIRHSTAAGEVRLRLTGEHGAVLLTVSNPGEPIPAEQRQQIFERFYRADSARTDTGHYGLGLAIAKANVTAHKGKIEVRCAEGRVEFVVRIPKIQ